MKKENEKPVEEPDGAQEEETREETPEEPPRVRRTHGAMLENVGADQSKFCCGSGIYSLNQSDRGRI